MKTFLALTAMLFPAAPAFAEENLADLQNRANFNKACKAMIDNDGPCHFVGKGGTRRHCVEAYIIDPRVTPECREVINEWKNIRKK